jgi:hypothetical protein
VLKKQCIATVWFIILGILFYSAQVFAKTEWDTKRTFNLKSTPLDVASSPRGSMVFVLTDKGEVMIHSADGNLKDTIKVGSHIDGIQAGSSEDELFIISKKQKSIKRIELSFLYDINVSGAPFKGPVDAPVVIAVYDDYQ